jgi:hypothetical protein
VCAGLAGRPGLLALDGDVLAGGAVAVSDGRRDYGAFWGYLLDIAREIQCNDLVPVYCCICLPEQVLASTDVARFSGVHFLTLVCDRDELRERILTRCGADSSVANIDFHLSLNDQLRQVTVAPPHSLSSLVTSGKTPAQTVAAAREWANDLRSRSRGEDSQGRSATDGEPCSSASLPHRSR